MRYPRSTTSTKYPEFIRKSRTLQRFKRQSVFPEIGLDNCEEKVTKGPFKGYRIVFSSDGDRGLWDISTMSMRGITSCQRWDKDGYHCKKLIGSMLDPYTGIIYLTRGIKTSRGEKMEKRAVVRFILRQNKTPMLFLERIYGISYVPPRYTRKHQLVPGTGVYENENVIVDLFSSLLKAKTGKKYNVEYRYTSAASYIPLSSRVRPLSDAIRSYRDSGIGYSDKTFPCPKALLKQLE
jgi:hypothetical protein